MNLITDYKGIRTFMDVDFDIQSLNPDMIDINDIAHALSHTPRFGGHTHKFLSVAEHSVHVCNKAMSYHLLGHLTPKTQQEFVLTALLHDASEAYICDIPDPIKKYLPDYKVLERDVQAVIFRAFEIGHVDPKSLQPYPIIKDFDRQLLQEEWEAFMIDDKADPWSPMRAKNEFLKTFRRVLK